MKIVILESATTNPGDISWKPITDIAETDIYDTTENSEIVSRAKDADVIVVNKNIITREVIDALPNLKFIALLSTGYNVVDLDAAKERSIPVANVPAYSTVTVAQHVFALLLELTNSTSEYSSSVKSGAWQNSKTFTYFKSPITELDTLTMGIVGYGAIGRKVAEISETFGMDVIVNTRTPRPKRYPNTNFVDIETLFSTADVISLHLPLNDKTKHIVSDHLISMMKPSAYIINTSRGPVIDEVALANALNAEKIKGAGLDVLSTEPPKNGNPMLTAKNTVITPHVAWASSSARTRLVRQVAENIKAFIYGSPINVVNYD